MVERVDDIDELGELFDHLFEDRRITRAGDGHAREAGSGARADHEAFDVITPAREDHRDANEDARRVADEQSDRVEILGHIDCVLTFAE